MNHSAQSTSSSAVDMIVTESSLASSTMSTASDPPMPGWAIVIIGMSLCVLAVTIWLWLVSCVNRPHSMENRQTKNSPYPWYCCVPVTHPTPTDIARRKRRLRLRQVNRELSLMEDDTSPRAERQRHSSVSFKEQTPPPQSTPHTQVHFDRHTKADNATQEMNGGESVKLLNGKSDNKEECVKVDMPPSYSEAMKPLQSPTTSTGQTSMSSLNRPCDSSSTPTRDCSVSFA